MTVCWIDFLARGRASRARPADEGPLGRARRGAAGAAALAAARLALPLDASRAGCCSRGWWRSFNRLNYWQARRAAARRHRPPRDLLLSARRRSATGTALYGRRGFTQYQCVLPAAERPRRATGASCTRCARSGGRRLPVRDQGLRRRRARACCRSRGRASRSRSTSRSDRDTQALVDALNELVIAEGGRIYLAKDAFTRAEHFRAMEPRLDAWNAVRRTLGSRTARCAARSRCACSETRREGGVPRRHQGHGPRPGAPAWRERGDQLFLLGRDRDDLAAQRRRPAAPRRRRHGRHRALRPARARHASRRRSTPRVAALGGLRHRRRDRRPVRHPGGARGGRRADATACSPRTSPTRSCSASRRASACSRAGGGTPVRLQLGGRRARPQAGHPLRRRQGRALALPRRPRPQVPRAGPADDPGEARLREDRHDRRPARRRRSPASRTTVARAVLRAIDRGTPVVYAPGHLALDHAGDPHPAARRDAADRLLGLGVTIEMSPPSGE